MNTSTPPNTVYRFRSTEVLLDKYQELENQTIYFASPDELNDPMEGFRDIMWCGDKIVWQNFFKIYVYCLHVIYSLFRTTGGSKELDASDIPTYGQWRRTLAPEEQKLFDDIWDGFLNLPNIPEIIEALANTNREIRYRELKYYLRLMHSSVLNEIIGSYIAHNILPESERPEPNKKSCAQAPLKRILTTIKRNEEGKTEKEIHLDLLNFEAADNNHFIFWYLNNLTSPEKLRKNNQLFINGFLGTCLRKIRRRLLPSWYAACFQKNNQLFICDFPSIYLREIGWRLLPSWYAACFTKSYHNSSVWGHYGDQHSGVCLIFDFKRAPQLNRIEFHQGAANRVPIRFFDVNYEDKPSEIDFFGFIGTLLDRDLRKLWFTDDKGNTSESLPTDIDVSLENYWDSSIHDITIKTKDWKYERECRLILQDIAEHFDEKDRRKLSYNFYWLKGIIFGINTSYEHKLRIIEIILNKCEEYNRTDFKFYQAYYSPEAGNIQKYRIPLSSLDETAISDSQAN